MSASKEHGGIHANVIKECSMIFALICNNIFHKSLKEGLLPNQWKVANVRGLFKNWYKTLCSNYRPVSLTSIVCKLLESLIRNAIMQFWNATN